MPIKLPEINSMAFPLETISSMESDLRFAGMLGEYEPKDGVAFLAFTFMATAPLVNRKGMAVTLPTHRNSIASAIHTLMDYDHQVEDLPPGKDKPNHVVGHICSLYMDETDIEDAEWYVEGVIPRRPVVTRGVMALYNRLSSVGEVVNEIREKREKWFFSVEVGRNATPPALWLFDPMATSHEIIPWDDAADEMREAALQPKEAMYKDKHIAYLLGGERGTIPYIGGAITQRPAGKEQQLEGHELLYICNWTNPDEQEFGEGLNYAVYDKLGDVPANLKTMDGVPMTLSQVNGIVRQAEAIERDNKGSNGWAIAKANFKKTHTIRDGRWVKKEEDKREASEGSVKDEGSTSKDNEGGIEIMTEEEIKAMQKKMAELEADLKTASEGSLAKALADGVVVKKEEMDKLVAVGVMKAEREKAIASLAVDEETRKEYGVLAFNSELYPFDDAGQKKLDEAVQRWSSIAEKLKDKKEEKKDDSEMHRSSMDKDDDKKDDFSPGGGDGKGDDAALIGMPRVGMAAS